MSDTYTAARTVEGHVLPVPGTWAFDTSHSSVEFSVRHMMVGRAKGRFAEWTGALHVADTPGESSVDVSIAAASIDTKDDNRDAHLRSADFLDVESHPELTFKSTRVDGSGNRWKVSGDLTIAGVTRPVVLDVELEGVVDRDPWGASRVAFSGRTEIDREAFGLTWNVALEAGGVLVGKTVKIAFEVQAVLQP
jgi:polyisoprenoid-binding protein YceI